MKLRVLTAAIAIPIVLVAVFLANPWPLFALALAAAVVGSVELGGILGGRPTRMPVAGLLAMALAAAHLAGAFEAASPQRFVLNHIGLIAAGLLGAALVIAGMRTRLMVEAASLWVTTPLAMLIVLQTSRTLEESAVWSWSSPLLLLLLPLWAGDTAGMVVGRLVGRRPLAPSISPGKTREGAAANLFCCVATALGVGAWQQIAPGPAFACGVACGLLGQAGDLFESALKRSAETKDSGRILPGHGGLLDRIDSLLFAAPAVTLILLLLPGETVAR